MSDNKLSPTRREFVTLASAIAASATLGCAASSTPTESSPASSRTPKEQISVTTPASADWPTLKRYDADHLTRIAMPIGGSGRVRFRLAGEEIVRDWELVNRPAKRLRAAEHVFCASMPNHKPPTPSLARSKGRSIRSGWRGPAARHLTIMACRAFAIATSRPRIRLGKFCSPIPTSHCKFASKASIP